MFGLDSLRCFFKVFFLYLVLNKFCFWSLGISFCVILFIFWGIKGKVIVKLFVVFCDSYFFILLVMFWGVLIKVSFVYFLYFWVSCLIVRFLFFVSLIIFVFLVLLVLVFVILFGSGLLGLNFEVLLLRVMDSEVIVLL